MATADITDLINYASCVRGCGLNTGSDVVERDVCKTRADIVPCTTQEPCPVGGTGTYFVNGFDLTHSALAYESATNTLFVGDRVAGVIGDSDGDGTPGPGALCPGATVTDGPGIALNESYIWYIDTNCDGIADIQISVTCALPNPTVSIVDAFGSPIVGASGTAIASGHDLKLQITGISDPVTGKPGLPAVFTFSGFTGSTSDGLGEDAFSPLTCAGPALGIEITKTASTTQLCPDATTTVTLTVHNTSTVAISSVTATDDLPAGISYVANSTGGTCATAEPTINGQTLTFNIGTLNADQTCTVTFTAQRVGTTCFGTVTNHSTASGSFTSACLTAARRSPWVLRPRTSTSSVSTPRTSR